MHLLTLPDTNKRMSLGELAIFLDGWMMGGMDGWMVDW